MTCVRRGFTKTDPARFGSSLAQRLIPTVDGIRDLATSLGMRPYRVSIVRTRWSGGKRGSGVEQVVCETLIEPTPKVTDMSGVAEMLSPVGIDELGSIVVTQISGRYTEEFLRGIGDDGKQPASDEQVYYEVVFFKPGDGDGERRRFTIKSAPSYRPGGVQWSVNLERTREARDRSGAPR